MQCVCGVGVLVAVYGWAVAFFVSRAKIREVLVWLLNAFLGVSFGEYRSIGYCRFVVLIGVVLGRILEIGILAVGVTRWGSS